MYLELTSLEEYLSFLTAQGINRTHCDLDSITGQADSYGNALITTNALFSQRIDDYIVCYYAGCGRTSNFHLKLEKQGALLPQDCILPKIRHTFEQLKQQVSAQGFEVLPGIWRKEAPEYWR